MQLNEHTNKQFISKLPKRGNNVQKTDEINMSRDRTGQDRTGQDGTGHDRTGQDRDAKKTVVCRLLCSGQDQ